MTTVTAVIMHGLKQLCTSGEGTQPEYQWVVMLDTMQQPVGGSVRVILTAAGRGDSPAARAFAMLNV